MREAQDLYRREEVPSGDAMSGKQAETRRRLHRICDAHTAVYMDLDSEMAVVGGCAPFRPLGIG
jgi:hypothetical protein